MRRIAAATALAVLMGAGVEAAAPPRPRMLIAEQDPFSGLPALRAR